MGIIFEYLRNPATFKRRQTIGCLGGCLGMPIILGGIAILIFVIERRMATPWVLMVGAVFGAIAFTVLSISYYLYKRQIIGR
ncbi:MAG TPA: hypothetical protein PLP21_12645 [Pyrinomonadaceae bacterium]|nr:hypothetical protein [Acidobacteriota bacterium]HQZ97161.1 hypothetical protein [Pyrinomonadaceae bacterium]